MMSRILIFMFREIVFTRLTLRSFISLFVTLEFSFYIWFLNFLFFEHENEFSSFSKINGFGQLNMNY